MKRVTRGINPVIFAPKIDSTKYNSNKTSGIRADKASIDIKETMNVRNRKADKADVYN